MARMRISSLNLLSLLMTSLAMVAGLKTNRSLVVAEDEPGYSAENGSQHRTFDSVPGGQNQDSASGQSTYGSYGQDSGGYQSSGQYGGSQGTDSRVTNRGTDSPMTRRVTASQATSRATANPATSRVMVSPTISPDTGKPTTSPATASRAMARAVSRGRLHLRNFPDAVVRSH